jgi:hypothetical protein
MWIDIRIDVWLLRIALVGILLITGDTMKNIGKLKTEVSNILGLVHPPPPYNE